MEYYPGSVYKDFRGEAYYRAFRYAALVELEAALRFPDTQEAAVWRWKAAYNLARSGDPQAGGFYANLIQNALQAGEVEIDDLNGWFNSHEGRLALRPVELEPLTGFRRMLLVELRGSGSAFLLILESAGGFQVWELATNFNFASPQAYDFAVGDLTGDGNRGNRHLPDHSPGGPGSPTTADLIPNQPAPHPARLPAD